MSEQRESHSNAIKEVPTLPGIVQSGDVETVKRTIRETWGMEATDAFALAMIAFVEEISREMVNVS